MTESDRLYAQALAREAESFLAQGRPALAEAYALEAVRAVPQAPEGRVMLGRLGLLYGQPEAAWHHFEAAGAATEIAVLRNKYGNPEGALADMRARREANQGKMILVKPWAYGFWADVFHVMGQALLGEITGRNVVVDWGPGSLYWHPDEQGEDSELFTRFFEPLSPATREQAYAAESFHPPKWTRDNMFIDFVNRWTGPYSRTYALPFLGRDEAVMVCDFVTSVHSLLRWLPSDHPLFGKDAGAAYAYLLSRHLRPLPKTTQAAEAFRAAHLTGGKTLAVHVRGLDKEPDAPDIEAINRDYLDLVDRWIATRNPAHILLITDSNRAVETYRARYGNRLVTTEALRPKDERAALYLRKDTDIKRRAMADILTDTYLAASCDGFIGNGWSNVSVAVRRLKSWPEGGVNLLGGDVAYEDFFSLFQPSEGDENRDRFAVANPGGEDATYP